MFSLRHKIREAFCLLVIPVLVLANAGQLVHAATLLTMSDSLSSNKAAATGVTHTINFRTETSDNILRIAFRFSTTSGGTTKPAGMDLSSATLTSTSGIGSGWALNTASGNDGLIYIGRASADPIADNVSASIVIGGITNPNIADCNASTPNLSDTCYVTITTYSDDSHTQVDRGSVGYQIIEDPYFHIDVDAVPSGETHNGVTTTTTSTGSNISFGNLSPGDVNYMAQKLTISTNAPQGYTIYAYLADPITGSDPNNQISPFGATDATWDTPQAWEDPYGSTPNSNTGWIAANTSDTRVSGWFGGSGKFGPISTTKRIVSTSTSAQKTPATIYVNYAFGINAMQPADTYTGKIIYEVLATY